MYSIIKVFILRLGCMLGVYISKIKSTRKEALEDFFANLRENSAQVDLIRIGEMETDLLPNDLKDVHFCMSPGVAESSDFEFQLASGYDIACLLISVSTVLLFNIHCLFTKKFISSYNDGQNMRLAEWVLAEDRCGKRFALADGCGGGRICYSA